MLKQVKNWCKGGASTESADILLARFGMVVFKCDGKDGCPRISRLPGWISGFLKDKQSADDARDLPFGFLQAFLAECDEMRSQGRDLPTAEEIWHEDDLSGVGHSLSVQIFEVDGKPYLLLQCIDDSFAEKQHVYQVAREQKLTLDALAKAEAALRESKQRLELIMRQAPAVFWCTDMDGMLTYFSGSATSLFAPSDGFPIGKSVLTLFASADIDDSKVLGALERALAGNPSTFTTALGNRFFDVRIEPMYGDDDWSVIGASGVCVESTERVKAEIVARDALQAKADFITGIAHEIRTPMNAIIGLIELTLDMRLDREQKAYLQSAISAGESLLGIIDQLLEFSRIEKGRTELDECEFDVAELVHGVLSGLAVHAHSKGLEIFFEIVPGVPDRLVGDVVRLRQILVNLVGNAIKFTQTGYVWVAVAAEKSNSQKSEVVLHFTVADTGIGVAPEKQSLIFEAFRQAENGTIRKYGGSGLGLSIASRLVVLFGGNIWVESPGADGKGSDFHFTVRLAERAGGRVSDGDASGAVQPTSCIVVGLRGRELDATLKVAQDVVGDCAVIAVNESLVAPVEVPCADASGLLLLDLPAENQQRRHLLKTLRGVDKGCGVVLAAVPVGLPATEIELLEELSDCIVHKPLAPGVLREVLSNCYQNSGHPIVEHQMPRKMRVLVADDNELNQWVITAIFRNRGHEVTLVSTGKAAIKQAERRQFDIMLLDFRMPDIDGYEVAERIRESEGRMGRSRLPIIALTAHFTAGTERRCLRAGMDAYLVKPVRVKVLFQTIEDVIAKVPENNAATDNTFSQILDVNKLRNLAGGDARASGRVLKGALNLLASKIDSIQTAINYLGYNVIADAAFAIGGMANEIGAYDLKLAAVEMEKYARLQDFDGVRARLLELQSERDRLLEHVKKHGPALD